MLFSTALFLHSCCYVLFALRLYVASNYVQLLLTTDVDKSKVFVLHLCANIIANLILIYRLV